MEEDKGILHLLPGHLIGGAMSSLPQPGPGQLPEISAEVMAGQGLGLVRIRYKLRRHNPGRSQTWFWVAVHAETVGNDPLQAA